MASAQKPGISTRSGRTAQVQNLTPKFVEVLDALLDGIKERSGFARITIEVADGKLKRFECTESYLVAAMDT